MARPRDSLPSGHALSPGGPGYRMFTKRATISVIPPQPKSDISDLGHLRAPNSGKPEFGWGGWPSEARPGGDSQTPLACLPFSPHPTLRGGITPCLSRHTVDPGAIIDRRAKSVPSFRDGRLPSRNEDGSGTTVRPLELCPR